MRLALLLPLLLSACAAVPPVTPATASNGKCEGTALAVFKGQAATSELGARMLAVSGAKAVRWVTPGMMVTMDFSADRLTVYLDRDNRVERASCG